MTTQKKFQILAAACLVALIIQVIPVTMDNPPVTGEIKAPAAVLHVFKRSCYDCHSNETKWPWYGKVAPMSWMLASDVSEARGKMNFSTWRNQTPLRQVAYKQMIQNEISAGEMPPMLYKLGHPDVKLSEKKKQTVIQWTSSAE